jgi:hypothetical protein
MDMMYLLLNFLILCAKIWYHIMILVSYLSLLINAIYFCQHTSIVASLRADFLPYKATIYWLANNLVRFCLPKDQQFGRWPNFRKVRLGNNSNIVFSHLPLCPLKSLRSSPSSVHDCICRENKEPKRRPRSTIRPSQI